MTHEIRWVTNLSCSCGWCTSTQRGFANMDRITMWQLSATTLICWMLHLQPTFSRQNQQNRHCVKLNPLDSCLLLVYQMNHQTVTQTEFNFTARQEKSSMTIKNKVQSYSDKLYLVGEHPEGEAAVGAGDALWDTPHGGPSVCTCLSPLTKRIFSW